MSYLFEKYNYIFENINSIIGVLRDYATTPDDINKLTNFLQQFMLMDDKNSLDVVYDYLSSHTEMSIDALKLIQYEFIPDFLTDINKLLDLILSKNDITNDDLRLLTSVYRLAGDSHVLRSYSLDNKRIFHDPQPTEYLFDYMMDGGTSDYSSKALEVFLRWNEFITKDGELTQEGIETAREYLADKLQEFDAPNLDLELSDIENAETIEDFLNAYNALVIF